MVERRDNSLGYQDVIISCFKQRIDIPLAAGITVRRVRERKRGIEKEAEKLVKERLGEPKFLL